MLIVKYDQRQWIATFVKSIYSGKQTNKTARYIVDNSFSCLFGHLASGLHQLRKQSPEINYLPRDDSKADSVWV